MRTLLAQIGQKLGLKTVKINEGFNEYKETLISDYFNDIKSELDKKLVDIEILFGSTNI